MKKLICVLLFICLFFSGCQNQHSNENWGSFTAEKTYSYDQKYYAIQNSKETDGISFIDIVIYNDNDEPVYTFTPARASDFWGICWEKDTYNIWIQSADIGVICYADDDDEVFIGRDLAHAKSHSETVSGEIDKEVKAIIDDCYKKATDTVSYTHLTLPTNVNV